MKYVFVVTVAALMLLSIAEVTADSPRRIQSLRRKPSPSCGVRKVTSGGLIVGGHDSIPGNWPWHAAVYHVSGTNHQRDYKCGATLINARYLLTTASCAYHGRGKPEGAIVVELGQFNLVESFAGKRDAVVQNVSIHEKYVPGEIMNDIALLRLKKDVVFTKYIQPVCLPNSSDSIENFVGQKGTIVGWGYRADGKLSEKLQALKVPIVSYIDCLTSDRDFFLRNIYSGMFCAGSTNATTPCFGDAGGGMFFQEDRAWMLRGIVSFTSSSATVTMNCDPQKYFGLVNVAHFKQWIEETIARLNDTSKPAVAQAQRQQQQQQRF
ncbi:venom protease-like [Wyeomyia smithii]|uniref:venom protease-like n=1 Tax=Wyeomyia smithii TaxID=174621 RepID=UPI0024681CE3|nr:venom protease-like [Wyeomyia smithii]